MRPKRLPRWAQFLRVCAATVLIISANLAAAGNEVEQAWDAQHRAIAALEKSNIRADETAIALDRLYAEFARAIELSEQRNQKYHLLTDAYDAVLRELEAQKILRLKARAIPDFMTVHRDDLEHHRDALMAALSYNSTRFNEELIEAHRQLREITEEISHLRKSGRLQIENEINPEIARLEQERKTFETRLLDEATLEDVPDLTSLWFNAAQDRYEAEERQAQDQENLAKASATYVNVLREAPPPFLQRVSINSDDNVFYDFTWLRDGYDDDATASVDYARQRQEIADQLPNYTGILESIIRQRSIARSDRFSVAIQKKTMADQLVALGENHYFLKRNKIIANAVVELAVASVEFAITGGAATAVRVAEQKIQDQLTETAAKGIKVVGVPEKYAAGALSNRMNGLLAEVGRREYLQATHLLNTKRSRFIAFEMEELALRELRKAGNRFDTLEEAYRNMPRAFIEDILQQIGPDIERRAILAYPAIDASRYEVSRKLASQINVDTRAIAVSEVTSDALITALGKSQDAYDAYSGNGTSPFLSNRPTSGSEIIEGQAIEWAIANGIESGIELKQIISSGGGIGELRPLARGVVVSAAFSTIEGSLKTIVSNSYDIDISETELQYWTLYAQISALEKYYYELTLQDQEQAEIEDFYRRATTQMNTYLAEIGLPRRPSGEKPEAEPILTEVGTVSIHLTFSTPLASAPLVHLGDELLNVNGEGRFWFASLSVTDAMRAGGSAKLSVELSPENAGYAGYIALDSQPQTIAHVPWDQKDWVGYERGTDSRHNVRFAPANIQPASMWVDWEASGNGPTQGYATGHLQLGDSARVEVKYLGEVNFTQIDGGTDYWRPSDPYLNAVVDEPPPNSELIGIVGGSGALNRVEFSAPVRNPVMAIVSMGQFSVPVEYKFNVPIRVLSQGQGYWGNGRFEVAGTTLTGFEAHGTIQIVGEVSSFEWVVPTAENWHGFTIGAPN